LASEAVTCLLRSRGAPNLRPSLRLLSPPRPRAVGFRYRPHHAPMTIPWSSPWPQRTWLVYVLDRRHGPHRCPHRLLCAPLRLARFALQIRQRVLPDWASGLAGWALLLAMSPRGLRHRRIRPVRQRLLQPQPVEPLRRLLATIASSWLAMAYRDIRLSARSMLWLEAASLAASCYCYARPRPPRPPHRHGAVQPARRFRLRHASRHGPALFSFVGFESATALGEEARNPLKTIPRAVLQSAIGLGFLFVVCAYTEVLGFRV